MSRRPAKSRRAMVRVADCQLEAAAPTFEAMAAVYQELVRDGWNPYFARRHRLGLLPYDASLLIESAESTVEGVQRHLSPFMRQAGGKSLKRLILKHHHDKPMLLALAGAFLIEQIRRGGFHE